MKYSVVLHLDAPFQSWGIDSRFNYRHAGVAPSKSAICGMVCAAMGVEKESSREEEVLVEFRNLRMSSYCLKTNGQLRDYHTVQNYKTADGKSKKDSTILTYRYYWQSSEYLVLLTSENKCFLEEIRNALLNPVWGIWFGRKCCIPAAPIIQEDVMEEIQALEVVRSQKILDAYIEVDDFNAGTDTWQDQPLGFGKRNSSGKEGRKCGLRRVDHVMYIDSGDTEEFFRF